MELRGTRAWAWLWLRSCWAGRWGGKGGQQQLRLPWLPGGLVWGRAELHTDHKGQGQGQGKGRPPPLHLALLRQRLLLMGRGQRQVRQCVRGRPHATTPSGPGQV